MLLETILHKIAVGAVIVATATMGLFGYSPQSEIPMGTEIPQVVALFETTLATKITSTATSMTLTSGTTKDGTTLSGFYGFIIDEGTASEEFVTASTTNTTAENITRGISVVSGDTEVSALKKEHRRGASVKITNHPVLAVMARIMNGDEDFPNTLNYATSPTFASSTSIVDKNYCDTTFVGLTGDETIAGLKTFSTLPQAPTSTPTVDGQLFSWYYLVNNYIANSGNSTIAGIKTFSSFLVTPSAAPTTDYQVCNKKYADDLAIAGAPDATLTVKGIVEMATDDEVKSGAATGTTEAHLFINPSDMAANYVNSSSTQDINGIKNFKDLPVASSTPTIDDQLTRKGYVDAVIGWELVASSTFAASSTIPLDGLTGNTDEIYKLNLEIYDVATNTITVSFNSDTTASNYHYYVMYSGQGSDSNEHPEVGADSMPVFNVVAEKHTFAEAIIYAKSGKYRQITSVAIGNQQDNGNNFHRHEMVGAWENTVNELTKIDLTFTNAIDAGEYYLYKIVK